MVYNDDFQGFWNNKCSKKSCGENMAASIADLGKENPKYKNSLEEWRTSHDNGSFICRKCWEGVKNVQDAEEWGENYKKQQKHKASHCRQCNNKSLFYHYIYDKRTKKIEQTSSNATDPENQLVFCNQDCYEKYFTTSCHQCSQSIKPGQTCFFSRNDSTIRFCSKSCGEKYLHKKQQQQAEEELKRKKKKLEKLEKEAQEAADQLFDNLIADIQAGKDISSYNWETADWLNDEQKEICRKYQQGRNKPNSDTANNDLDEKTNDPADHHHSPTTPSGPTNNPEDNSGNGDDSSPTSPPSNGDSPTSSFTPNKPTGNDQEEKCGICDQTFTDAEEHGRENPQCQAFCEACEKILNQGQTVDYSSVATSERGRLIIKTLQDLKIYKKWVDIDNLVLPIEAKENLKELRKQLGLYQDTTRDNPDEEKSSGGLNTQGKIGVSILSVGGFIGLIFLIRKLRRRSKRLKRKK
ncbi:MAG: hypothetical protein MRERV_3c049 [Mycoplasmataceae bacterium RV_VA103A]|nr:MAG: hypothetical protein MRERV_3c049 [Mycoplasmataceae bacterium RV_VA103A]